MRLDGAVSGIGGVDLGEEKSQMGGGATVNREVTGGDTRGCVGRGRDGVVRPGGHRDLWIGVAEAVRSEAGMET